MNFYKTITLGGLLLTAGGMSLSAEDVSHKNIQPLLEKYCVSCHGPKKQKGKFRLDTLDKHLAGKNKEEWNLVLESLTYEEMPPEDETQPSAAERKQLIDFITAQLSDKKDAGKADKKVVKKKKYAKATVHPDASPYFKEKVFPVLNKYCISCHGPRKQKAELRLDTLNPDMVKGFTGDHWHEILNTMNIGEMPPEDSKQPNDDERRILIDWMTNEIEHAKKVAKGESKTVIRRLTKEQYTNSLQDLLGITLNFGDILPPDGLSEEGFTNNGQTLSVSALHMDYFLKIAGEALDKAIVTDEKPPASHRYKWTFGTDTKQKAKGFNLGFQSQPLKTHEYRVDTFGPSKDYIQNETFQPEGDIRTRFYADMRGSRSYRKGEGDNRYWVDKEGLVLLPARPHQEFEAQMWQGPNPNVKAVLRDFPLEGDFRVVVEVAKTTGETPIHVNGDIMSLSGFNPIIKYQRKKKEVKAKKNSTIIFANQPLKATNQRISGSYIHTNGGGYTDAEYEFTVDKDATYQLDAVITTEERRPVTLTIGGHKISDVAGITTGSYAENGLRAFAVAAVKLKKGTHKLKFERNGPIPHFSHFILTPTKNQKIADIFAGKKIETPPSTEDPYIRMVAGNRQDDGMEYEPFGELTRVTGKNDEFKKYEFYGRLEDMPLPVIDPNDNEPLSNLMVFGLWNENFADKKGQKTPAIKVRSMSFEGPLVKSWPPQSHKEIFFKSSNSADEEAYTKEILKKFMTKAFRRKVYNKEVDRYMAFWKKNRQLHETYESSIKDTLLTVLCSPSFLYILEKKYAKEEKARKLNDFELATRLSYFLWNTMPDKKLMAEAKQGTLNKNIVDQMKRMIESPRLKDFIKPFTTQWLDVQFMDQTQIDVQLYPKYNRFTKRDMKEETYEFISKVMKDNLSILNFIDSEFVMLNQNLAQFYGIDGVTGAQFRAVKVDKSKNRGGLLSQGSFLAGHSSGDDSHPIKRGTWLVKKILDTPPPPPPPNVPALPEDDPNFAKLTKKEQLEKHRDNPSCRDCHKKIDPFGVAFEDYDAVGLWRNKVEKFDHTGKNRITLDLVSKATLPDNTEIDGVASLKKYILDKRKKDLTRSVAKHMLSYALGRSLSFTDEDELNKIIEKTEEDDYKMQTLVEAIVTSQLFTTK